MQTQLHPVLDDKRKWTSDPKPPHFDAEAFQERINSRVGLNRDGKPILRLVWAPAVMHHALGERVRRYWVTRTPELDGTFTYVSPPRWVVEKRLEKETYWDAHQATRYQTVEATGELVDMGPPPEDYYVFEYLIAEHDGFTHESGEPQCCARAWEGEDKYVLNHCLELVKQKAGARMRCWGYYREPGDIDLQRIEQAVAVMNADKFYDPYAPLSPEQLAVIEANANVDAQRMAGEREDYMRESSDDFLHSYGWRLRETDAGRLSHGRYHFMGHTWKAGRSGLTVPV